MINNKTRVMISLGAMIFIVTPTSNKVLQVTVEPEGSIDVNDFWHQRPVEDYEMPNDEYFNAANNLQQHSLDDEDNSKSWSNTWAEVGAGWGR